MKLNIINVITLLYKLGQNLGWFDLGHIKIPYILGWKVYRFFSDSFFSKES